MTGPATLNALEAARRPLTVTGTTRTLGLADAGAYLRFTNTSAKTCTVPPAERGGLGGCDSNTDP